MKKINKMGITAIILVLFAVSVLIYGCSAGQEGNDSIGEPTIKAHISSGTIIVPDDYESIKKAVKAAGENDLIVVRFDTYEETININKKTNLTIRGEGFPIVRGFKIVNSENIKIEGFDIETLGDADFSISINGGKKACKNIIISGNKIHGTGGDGDGIKIGKDCSEITLDHNKIYSNGGNGIFFEGNDGGPVNIINNCIVGNGNNGIYAGKYHNVLIEFNKISGNGTKIGENDDYSGYGVLRRRSKKNPGTDLIVLKNNVISDNNGIIVEGISDANLGNYDQMTVDSYLVSINVTPASVQLDGTGTQQFTAVIKNSKDEEPVGSVSWSVSPAEVGSINENGLFAAADVSDVTSGNVIAKLLIGVPLDPCTLLEGSASVEVKPLLKPMVWWKLDEEPGAGTAVDSINGSHNGHIVNNPEVIDGVDGKALRLKYWNSSTYGNGYVLEGSHVLIPGSYEDLCFHGNEDFSISMWVRVFSGDKCGDIIGKGPGYGEGGSSEFFINLNSSTKRFLVYSHGSVGSAGPYYSFSQNGAAPVGKWFHLVVVREGTSQKLYLNGQVIASGNFSNLSNDYILRDSLYWYGPGKKESYDWVIGQRGRYCNAPFEGDIDDVRIYSQALDQDTVLSLYNQFKDNQ